MTLLWRILTLQGRRNGVELKGRVDCDILTMGLSKDYSSSPSTFPLTVVLDDICLWVICGEQKFEWELFRNAFVLSLDLVRQVASAFTTFSASFLSWTKGMKESLLIVSPRAGFFFMCFFQSGLRKELPLSQICWTLEIMEKSLKWKKF